jgi:hypothetical protein
LRARGRTAAGTVSGRPTRVESVGQTVQIFAFASSGPSNTVDLYNGSNGSSNFGVDLAGYFATD